jgi:acyl carrier protein
MSDHEIIAKIADIIGREWPGNVPADGIHAGTPLFYEGIALDSIDGVTLILSLEEQFEVEIDHASVDTQAFENVGALARLVEERLRAVA